MGADRLNQNQDQDIKHHDNLGAMLHVEEFTDNPCGSLSGRTGKKMYCCNECPTLQKDIIEKASKQE